MVVAVPAWCRVQGAAAGGVLLVQAVPTAQLKVLELRTPVKAMPTDETVYMIY